jgi:LPXTG-site transpeptidase (sortase) family protein
MATPNNIYFTGWYVESVVPGEKGVSILNGHVGGRYSPGIFKDLKNIEEGKSIRVEMGDLSWREFRVVSTTSYALSEAAEPLFHNDPRIDQELHLITCDGVYNKATETYDQRIIVVAERIL